MVDAKPGRLFKAFISYSHKDRKVADKLFRILDAYRVPKDLVGVETDVGAVPSRLHPIFRDREELASASDLTERIKGALSRSETLIVICSSHAAASEWVNREIEAFADGGKAQRVFAIIAQDEPPHCFPPALLKIQPNLVASDLRAHADGWSLAPVKIIAGVLGVDAGLVQDRELRRERSRARLRTALASGFAFLSIASIASAAFAWQNAEARERMLVTSIELTSGIVDRVVDMRDYLPREMISGLLDQAEGGFRQLLSQEQSNARLQYQYGRLLLEMARHQSAIGNTSRQLANAEEAARVLKLAARSDDANEDIHALMAAAELEVGDALRARGFLKQAEQRYANAQRLMTGGAPAPAVVSPPPVAGAIAAPAPIGATPPRPAQLEAAQARREAIDRILNSENAFGVRSTRNAPATPPSAAARSRSAAEASAWALAEQESSPQGYRRFISEFPQSLWVPLAAARMRSMIGSEASGYGAPTRGISVRPPDPRELDLINVATRIKQADLFVDQQRLDDAMTLYAEALRILREKYAQSPGNASVRADLIATYVKIGDVHRAKSSFANASSSYASAYGIALGLAASAPSNNEWKTYVGVSRSRSAMAHAALGDFDTAILEFSSAREIYSGLIAADPLNKAWQRDLSTVYGSLGDLAVMRGDLGDARVQYRLSNEIIVRLTEQDASNTVWKRDLAYSYVRLAQVSELSDDTPGALDLYRKADRVLAVRTDGGADARWSAQATKVRQRIRALTAPPPPTSTPRSSQ